MNHAVPGHRPFRWIVIAACAAVAGTLALSGCGVSVVDDDDQGTGSITRTGPSSTSATGQAPSDSPTGEDNTSTGPDQSTPSAAGTAPSGGAGPSGDLTYSGFAARFAAVNKEIPCDRGPVQITESGPAIRLVGSCGQVTISGDAVAVIANDVDSVTVSGSGVVLMTTSVGDVTLTGDAFASEVYWINGQPDVTDNGAGNTVRSIPEGS